MRWKASFASDHHLSGAPWAGKGRGNEGEQEGESIHNHQRGPPRTQGNKKKVSLEAGLDLRDPHTTSWQRSYAIKCPGKRTLPASIPSRGGGRQSTSCGRRRRQGRARHRTLFTPGHTVRGDADGAA